MSADSLTGIWPVFPVHDVDATALILSRDGVEISVSSLPGARSPEGRWYGQREVEVRDPNGYVLVFAEEKTGEAM